MYHYPESNFLKNVYHRNECFVGCPLSVCFLDRRITFASAKELTRVARIAAFFRVLLDTIGRMPTITRWICAGFFQVLLARAVAPCDQMDWFPSASFLPKTPFPSLLFLLGDRRPGEGDRVLSLWPFASCLKLPAFPLEHCLWLTMCCNLLVFGRRLYMSHRPSLCLMLHMRFGRSFPRNSDLVSFGPSWPQTPLRSKFTALAASVTLPVMSSMLISPFAPKPTSSLKV